MEGLLTNHMSYSCIVITIPEEAALYGNVQQVSDFPYSENIILKTSLNKS